MKNLPKVVIIILNWNGFEDTLECLRSLSLVDYPNYEIIIVDNASSGIDVDVLRTVSEPRIRIIENHQNYGYAEGNNIGIRYALQIGAEFLLLLNNDTVVASDFLTKMVHAAGSDDQIGILTPTIYSYDHPGRIQDQGRNIGWYGPPKKNIRFEGNSDANQVIEIEAALGTSMLIRKETIDKIGVLASEYYYQVEDTDFCVRARNACIRIACVPQASIWHKGSASLNKVPAYKLGYFIRNRFVFRAKYATNLQLAVFVVWFFFIEGPMKLAYYLFRFGDIRIVKGLFWGTKEGVFYLLNNWGNRAKV